MPKHQWYHRVVSLVSRRATKIVSIIMMLEEVVQTVENDLVNAFGRIHVEFSGNT